VWPYARAPPLTRTTRRPPPPLPLFSPPPQVEYDNLKKRFALEMRELERKFEPLYAAVCESRRAVVTGAVDPVASAAAGAVTGIPEFWLRAMMNCRSIAEFIEEHDLPVLKYLQDVTTAYVGDLAGFRLDFHFAPNPYFENARLSKVFHIPKFVDGAPVEKAEKKEGEEAKAAAAEEEEEEDFDEDSFDVKKIEGTEIAWKPGHNVTVKVLKKKQKGKGGKPGKTTTKEEELPSFFRFFEAPDVEAIKDAEDEEEVRTYPLPHPHPPFAGASGR
jgi:nucleosome assembly protein 1-like 1